MFTPHSPFDFLLQLALPWISTAATCPLLCQLILLCSKFDEGDGDTLRCEANFRFKPKNAHVTPTPRNGTFTHSARRCLDFRQLCVCECVKTPLRRCLTFPVCCGANTHSSIGRRGVVSARFQPRNYKAPHKSKKLKNVCPSLQGKNLKWFFLFFLGKTPEKPFWNYVGCTYATPNAHSVSTLRSGGLAKASRPDVPKTFMCGQQMKKKLLKSHEISSQLLGKTVQGVRFVFK